ncbi:MAG: GtrA family protein [Halothiobacillaceae bacterium]
MRALLNGYLTSNSVPAQFMRFGTVGVKVSLIDIGGLYLLHVMLGANLYVARVLSLGSAILVGYLLNRYFTFDHEQRGCFYRQMAGHFGVHVTGGLINYGVFSVVLLSVGHLLPELSGAFWMPLVAVVAGGVVGMTFNFAASRRFVFRRTNRSQDQ